MNKDEDSTIQSLATSLAAVLAERAVQALSLPRDAVAEISGTTLMLRFRGRVFRRDLVLINRITPAVISRFAAVTGEPKMLISPYVSPAQADALRIAGVAFMDSMGNVFLDEPPGLYLFVNARSPAAASAKASAKPSISVSGVRVLFVLLADQLLQDRGHRLKDGLYRAIKAAADVSLGSVSHVHDALSAARLLSAHGSGFAELVFTQDLADRWAAAYNERLRHRLVIGRFRSPVADWWHTAELESGVALWGGETAGAKLTGHLKPIRSTLYLTGELKRLLTRHSLQADPEGDVEILAAFWRAPWLRENQCAVPLLVYADLMALEDERCIETARELYARYLHPGELAR